MKASAVLLIGALLAFMAGPVWADMGAPSLPLRAPQLHPDPSFAAQAHVDVAQNAVRQALACLAWATTVNHGGYVEKAMVEANKAADDLTRISAYLKAHPEANTLADGMAPAEASPAKLMVAPDAARKNARSPGGPGGSPLQNMLSTLDELNIALNEFINPTTIPTGSKSPIMGDLGGLRKTLIDDLVQANADVLAGINYANGSDVPPATPAPAVQPTKAGVTEDDSGNGARLPSAMAGLALSAALSLGGLHVFSRKKLANK